MSNWKKTLAREYLIVSSLVLIAVLLGPLVDLLPGIEARIPTLVILFVVLVWLRYAWWAARTVREN